MTEKTQYRLIHPLKHYRDCLEHNLRPDGRRKAEFRPVGINCFRDSNVPAIQTADGSAIVKLGNTAVVCGIKAELAEPKATEPDRGFIVPNIELTPLCASKFRPGAPTEEAQTLALSLNDIVSQSRCFDLKDLCIARERLVWVLYCDVVCLNYDGCVLDAAVLAVMTALQTLTLPVVTYNTELRTYKVEHENRVKKFTLDSTPVSSTFISFADTGIIVDPTAEEEGLASGSVSITIHNSEIVFTLKSGGACLSADELDHCIKVAISRAHQTQALVKSVI